MHIKKLGEMVRTAGFAAILLFLGISCENVGLLGQSGVPGNNAQQEILDASLQIRILFAADPGFMQYLGMTSADYVIGSVMVDGLLIPGILSLDVSKHYTRESVNDCVSKIRSLGLMTNPITGAVACNLKTSPQLIQLGPIGL